MVLILLLASIFISPQSLLDKYEKPATKEIKKKLSLNTYEFERLDFEEGELYTINSDNKVVAYILLSEVAACNLGGCPIYKAVEQDASSEYFDLMTIIDTDSKILSIKILDYFSDYGYEITSKKYLRKFKGYKVCTISEEKDDVDAISGATISSYALEAKLGQLCGFI